jgi:phage tail-like protein
MSAKLAAQPEYVIDIAYQFEVRVADGGEVGNFLSVEGLGRTVDVYEYVEGGHTGNVHALPGQVKLGEMTLKWGWLNLSWLHAWANQVEIGHSFRKDLIISQLTREGKPLRVYTITGAWPFSWTAANLDAGSSQLPVEELKLRFKSMKLDIKDPGRRSRGAR